MTRCPAAVQHHGVVGVPPPPRQAHRRPSPIGGPDGAHREARPCKGDGEGVIGERQPPVLTCARLAPSCWLHYAHDGLVCSSVLV